MRRGRGELTSWQNIHWASSWDKHMLNHAIWIEVNGEDYKIISTIKKAQERFRIYV